MTELTAAKRLLTAQVVSDIGDALTKALVALTVLDLTTSTTQAGFVYFADAFAFFLFSLVGGKIGDRKQKLKIMYCSDVLRASVILIVIFAFWVKSLSLLYVATFCLSMIGAFFRPSMLGFWAQNVPNEHLDRFNSYSELSIHTTMILGPVVAAIFAQHNLSTLGFAFDSLTFALSASLYFSLRSIAKPQVFINIQDSKKPKFSQLFSEIVLILKSIDLRRYVGFDAIQMITFGAFNATLFILLQRDYGYSKADYGTFMSITAVGSVLGGLLAATKVYRNFSLRTKLLQGSAIPTISLLLILIFKNLWITSVLHAVCEIFVVASVIYTRTSVQRYAARFFPDRLSGVMGSRSVLIRFATFMGTGICLIASEFFSLYSVLFLLIVPILSTIAIAMSFSSTSTGLDSSPIANSPDAA